MTYKLENNIRRQQVKLLKFEKFLRTIAPIVIASGISSANVETAQAHLAGLAGAKHDFAKIDATGKVSRVLGGVELVLASEVSALADASSSEARAETMVKIMTAVDTAHRAAQDSAVSGKVRLLGQKVRDVLKADGGTPKVSNNAAWLKGILGV